MIPPLYNYQKMKSRPRMSHNIIINSSKMSHNVIIKRNSHND